jgi:hypothetical protein
VDGERQQYYGGNGNRTLPNAGLRREHKRFLAVSHLSDGLIAGGQRKVGSYFLGEVRAR